MSLLFQLDQRRIDSPRPEVEKDPAHLTRVQQIAIVQEAFKAVCNSMKLLGYNVEKLLKSGKLDDFKNAKPAKTLSEEKRTEAKREYGHAITALQYLDKRLPGVPRDVREGKLEATFEQGRKMTIESLTSGLDPYPDGYYLYGLKRLKDSYVLESKPRKLG